MKWRKVPIYVICVILNVKHKKNPYRGCYLIVVHCWWRHGPPATPLPIKYTSCCWKDQRFSIESKIVLKYYNISKILASINPPPHPVPLYHGGGMNLRVRPRVKTIKKNVRIGLQCGDYLFQSAFTYLISELQYFNCNFIILGTLKLWYTPCH